MDFLSDTTHLHILTWVVGVVLFLVATGMAKGSKGRKITHMITRLFYVLIIISGLLLFMRHSSLDAALYGVKFLLGVLTIGMMEMVLVRSSKDKSTTMFWVLFAIFLFATMFIGFKLPIGIDWFY
ncbi:YisL family protein [Sporosarcina sp. CAU 1771]